MDTVKRPQRFIWIAGLVTLFGIGGLGAFLMYFFHPELFSELITVTASDFFRQFLTGSLFALVASIILLLLLRLKMLDATRYFFADLMRQFKLNNIQIVLLSFCAGVGEELLFRGAIQPWLGIWLTAIIFIALHGYLNPKDKPLFIYGTVLLIISAGFGYLMQISGLYAAMTAHFWIDVVLMVYLKQHLPTPKNEQE